ncbi:hypothetical protein [Psychromarinibacter halotolerans]|uniref:Uncharacterized protein n=1 Tax=Psychromarinibacter halotolerans TaxID=1775175 RepID=A0ABV7GPH0_9RHOB|nr:hypothetical protein [Psychromarinibacter halotolerans]MDF0595351.1 hypothetical protein [Psychromarinibacter halotolerans]
MRVAYERSGQSFAPFAMPRASVAEERGGRIGSRQTSGISLCPAVVMLLASTKPQPRPTDGASATLRGVSLPTLGAHLLLEWKTWL